jgi:DNA-binding NarL/FixJ family response regulator
MGPLSLLLVDDCDLFLRDASLFLQEHHGKEITIVGTTRNTKDALRLVEALEPRVVILDLMLPGLGGLGTVLELRHRKTKASIIVLTRLAASPYRHAALAAGADAFISKTNWVSDLIPAIHHVARARGWEPTFA